uniref:Uncharacterized protein n=1 Tax=Anguilla anguilla TaxID=7936 RepID=A0A0E9T782_ANGAN
MLLLRTKQNTSACFLHITYVLF